VVVQDVVCGYQSIELESLVNSYRAYEIELWFDIFGPMTRDS
jgi:hypothetical protein